MRIALMVEGETEKAFLPKLRDFLSTRLQNRMPSLSPHVYDGRIPKGDKLRRRVMNLLEDNIKPADAVIALTDVYTGTADFTDAADAKEKMRGWVGPEARFHPHAAQHDFEAWLLPYWSTIQQLAKHNKTAPSGRPEAVNHNDPPAHRIEEVFEIGKCRRSYIKPRDGARILRDCDLMQAIQACPELKALVNTILTLAGAMPVA